MKDKLDIDNLPDLLTIGEVASIFRVSTLTIKRWDKSRGLKPIRINTRGDRRYRREEVLDILSGKI